MASSTLRRIAGPIILSVSTLAIAQTGQALIGNPLLSPSKIKEVKRQIVEAAHRELTIQPAPVATPPAPPPSPMVAMNSMAPARLGPPIGELAKLALARLQVVAIVGRTALLAMPAHVQPELMQMQPMPMSMQAMQNPQMQVPGMQPGMQGQQSPQSQQIVRRASSALVRDHEAAYIEGFDVTPIIKGDTVRLVLASAPNTTIFQGMIQPALRSPSLVVAPSALEKPSSDYVQGAGPDATSMTSPNAPPPATGQQAGQVQGQGQPLRSQSYN